MAGFLVVQRASDAKESAAGDRTQPSLIPTINPDDAQFDISASISRWAEINAAHIRGKRKEESEK